MTSTCDDRDLAETQTKGGPGNFWTDRLERNPPVFLALVGTLFCVILANVIGISLIHIVNHFWFLHFGEVQITGLGAPTLITCITTTMVAFPILRYILRLFLTLNRTRGDLALAAEKARSASRMKSAFLASTSHEIRTPLNGVIGMVQVLQKARLPKEQADQVDSIAEAARSLSRLLGDILDISKVEAGRMAIAPAETDFRAIIEANASLWGPVAAEKNLSLTTTIDDDTPSWINCDGDRVRQCVANLTSNAIKFTESGGVAITIATRRSKGGEGVLISIAVQDTGPGVPEGDRERLFAPFEQVGSAQQRRAGTGLGLAISRNLARLMGGDITVDAAVGVGSTFTFTFLTQEVKTPAAAFAPEDIAKTLPPQRLLVTDDNETNRTIARLLLSSAGHEVITAEGGVETLRALSGREFDAVLLDMHMPDLDGPETLRRIRASRKPWADVKVIALTADAMSGDRARYLALGMDGYGVKPIELNLLLAEIARVVNCRPRQPMIAATPAINAP